MTRKQPPTSNRVDGMSQARILAELKKRRDAVTTAEDALAHFLLEVHDSSWWPHLRYHELAAALGCSRQAAQQRVARLLDRGRVVHARWTGVHPDQLSLDEAPGGS